MTTTRGLVERMYGAVEVPLIEGGGIARILEEWPVHDGRVAHARIFWFEPPTH